MAEPGRCRPGSAALSGTRWCARQPWYSDHPARSYRIVLGIILFAAMVTTFLIAGGMGSRPEEDELTPIEDDDAPFVEEEDDGSVSLGWAFHAAMSAKARLWRFLSLVYSWLVASAPPPRTSFVTSGAESRRPRSAIPGPAGR